MEMKFDFAYGSGAVPMTVKAGQISWSGQTTLLCVCNGRHYGGGFMPVPEAMPDDGVLDMLVVPGISLFTVAKVIGKYAKGQYKKLPHLVLENHGDRIEFSSPEEIVAVVDGEVVQNREFVVRLSEKKVNFFYPAQASYVPTQLREVSTPSI